MPAILWHIPLQLLRVVWTLLGEVAVKRPEAQGMALARRSENKLSASEVRRIQPRRQILNRMHVNSTHATVFGERAREIQ